MKTKYFLMAAVTALMTAYGTASEVPLTSCTHRISISDAQPLSLSSQEYTKFMVSAECFTDAKNTAMAQHVGHNLANAVETCLCNNGYVNEINNFKWESNLVQDKQASIPCTPGGRTVVYERLLPYTQSEANLITVLGYGIAHAVAKHSAEQITKQMNQQAGANMSGTVLNSTVDSGVGDTVSQITERYFPFRSLRCSRDNEGEVDYTEFIFAAMAGYDPANVVTS